MIHSLLKSIDETEKQQLLFILQKQIGNYLGDTSTSISISECNELLKSILFTFQTAGCQQFNSENFLQCQKFIENLSEHILQQKEGFLKKMIPIHSLAYQQSIQSIYAELPNYPFEFFAHEIIGKIDYPLALPIDDTQILGIRYIEEYLSRLTFENEFCQAFSSNDLQLLLSAYQVKSQVPYPEDLFNLFELLFDQTFSVFLAEFPIRQAFHITYENQEEIRHVLLHLPLTQSFLKQRLIDFLKSLSLDTQTTYYFNYLEKYQQKLIGEQQFNQSTLSFLLTIESNKQTAWQLQDYTRISDTLFEQTIEKLPFLNVKEKYELLIQNQLTLFDFLEIFESQWILPNELPNFFSYCSNEWIAAFIFFSLRNQRERTIELFEKEYDYQYDWEQILQETFTTLFDSERKQQIEQLYLFLFNQK